MEDEIRYTLAEDSHGDLALWSYWGEADTRPEALADVTTTDSTVFRAAESVLVLNPIIENLVVRAIDDPEAYIDADKVAVNGSLDHQAQAVLAALRDHATGGGQS